MKGYIPQDKIGEIKSRVGIVDLISEYVTLKKAGRNFVGLCPFHKEKTPSFSVNPEKQIFYCFGCGEGGDIFAFLMKVNGISFAESVRYLANKAGISLPVRRMTGEEKTKATEKEKLYRVNTIAAEFFSGQLSIEHGYPARQYLHARKMGSDIAGTFRLGYAPEGWNNLVSYLEKRKVPLGLAEKAGLVVSKETGGYYDRFRKRLVFPIEDLSERVVAFGGRVIDGADTPKYLNSPESPVYTKGKLLYGLSRTKEAIRDRDYVVLVEGYIDLISLWNAGVRNVVATLGTALTTDQVGLIRRFTRNVAVIFDPDEAGRHAVERSLKLFLEERMHARVVILPEGLDPDDYVKKYDATTLEEVIARAPMMVDYYVDTIMGGDDTLEHDLDAIRDSIPFIRAITDPIERNLFIKRVSERLGIDQSLLKGQVEKASPSGRNAGPTPSVGNRGRKVDMVELNLIYMMMEYPERVPAVARARVLDFFVSDELKRLGQVIIEGERDGNSLIDDLEDGPVKERLLKLMMEQPFSDSDIAGRELKDSILKIRGKWYKSRHALLKKELIRAQQMGDRALSDRLLRDKDKLLKEERGLVNNEKGDQIG